MSMWVLFTRALPPDAPYWSGRRWLAALDAVAWPCAAWYWLSQFTGSGGLVFALAQGLLVVSALRRLSTALHVNHRYHFTTWRWGRVVVWLLAIGAVLSVGLPS
jgi:hypothetical protein